MAEVVLTHGNLSRAHGARGHHRWPRGRMPPRPRTYPESSRNDTPPAEGREELLSSHAISQASRSATLDQEDGSKRSVLAVS